ncbi:hypothetical protein pb186bvf_018924 [Paramecium bursaria]
MNKVDLVSDVITQSNLSSPSLQHIHKIQTFKTKFLYSLNYIFKFHNPWKGHSILQNLSLLCFYLKKGISGYLQVFAKVMYMLTMISIQKLKNIQISSFIQCRILNLDSSYFLKRQIDEKFVMISLTFLLCIIMIFYPLNNFLNQASPLIKHLHQSSISINQTSPLIKHFQIKHPHQSSIHLTIKL